MEVLYFCGGALFIAVIYPLLVSIVNLITGRIEYKTSIWSLQLQKIAKNWGLVEENNEPVNTQVIGFQVPNEEYDDDECCKGAK